jgi:hypothetical protein
MVRAMGIAILAVGLTAQAAQAKPLEVLPRQAVVQGTPHVHTWKMHAIGNPAARGHASVTVVHPPTAVPLPAQSSGGMNWTAVLGGAAIVGLVGVLGAALFRLRPQRPAAA